MTDMTGKHVIVTGATNGIGEEAALEIARMGATVCVISRSEAKCQATVARIKSETGNPNVSYIAADLSSIDGAIGAANTYKAQFDRLDVLLNNAGAVFDSYQTSADGLEMTFALNHLNYFLMARELQSLLVQTAAANPDWGARIINVSSDAHRVTMNWENLQGEKGYQGFQAYGQSKQMNILHANELARRLQGTDVTVNSLHPGLVATGFGKNGGAFMRMAASFLHLFAKSSSDGAQTSIYLATSPDVKGVTGKYFANSQEKTPIPATQDPTNWERLWAYTERVLAEKETVTA